MTGVEALYVYVSVSSALGLLYSVFNILMLQRVPVGESSETGARHVQMKSDGKYLLSLIGRRMQRKTRRNLESGIEEEFEEDAGPYYKTWEELVATLNMVSDAISTGAKAFLYEEYKTLGIFVLVASLVIALLGEERLGEFWTVGAFLLGALTSVASGYIGMRVAVFANSRTAYSAIDQDHGLAKAFVVAFRGGCVLGFSLTSLALVNLLMLIRIYEYMYLSDAHTSGELQRLYEAIAGYGLGGSTIALFSRVGGGIFTKAADVGADLAGKVEAGLEEDDPRNPATIADNVGDNVGDIAGMGADLFGSFAESTCAALIIGTTSEELASDNLHLLYPLAISATGILVCLFTTIFATNIMRVDKEEKIERTLKFQLLIATFLLSVLMLPITVWCLPDTFIFSMGDTIVVKNLSAYVCVLSGIWAGLGIGVATEYYTSHSYRPVREIAESCRVGAAPSIIYGLSLGYISCIIPTICLAVTIYTSFFLAGMYGISLAALGMLSNLCIALAIDGFGPISDNAGGMVEMVHLRPEIRRKTDALDAAGNTTAAIGKGYAIGSATLVSLALFGAFSTRAEMTNVNILAPLQLAGLLMGAMLPYAFSALTMKSVGKAANEMVIEVRRQFAEMQVNPSFTPEYAHCVRISTHAALKEMIAPGVMVCVSPIVTGWLFGPKAVAGLLLGILVSGVQLAISSANSGGAWDNSKKYVEKEGIVPKSDPNFRQIKAAAVTGDTVGDPMKDTSGPSLNILIKLSAITSLVFGGFFNSSWGGLLVS
jgi:H(+)-translocating pyrophosphatase